MIVATFACEVPPITRSSVVKAVPGLSGSLNVTRNTTFVSVHFGNNSEDPFWVGKMLDANPNMYVDIAARVPELGRHDPEKLHLQVAEAASSIKTR